MTLQTFIYREQTQAKRAAKRTARMNLALSYGSSLDNPPKGFIHDVDLLPAGKLELINAIFYVIANADTVETANLFITAVFTLAFSQEGVGASLGLPGADLNIEHLSPDATKTILADFPFERTKLYFDTMRSDTERLFKAVKFALAANVLLIPWHRKLWHRLVDKGQCHRAYAGFVDFPD